MFQNAYEAFIKFHIKHRVGQSADRIRDGLPHAEKLFLKNVWWPAFHSFDWLHPEYEIHDYRDGNRYLDFAYIPANFKVAIEIDGIGSHWRDISQSQFSDQWHRQNHLIIDKWLVLRFTYADVENSPRICQQTIQQLLGRLASDPANILQSLELRDREIIRLALASARPITPNDVSTKIGFSGRTAVRRLKRLTESGWLTPASGSERIRSYRIHPTHSHILL